MPTKTHKPAPMPDEYKDLKVLRHPFTHCNTADEVEAGEIRSTSSPEQWHDLCLVALLDLNRWRLSVCSHEWHETHPRCRACRRYVPIETLDGTYACADKRDCFEAIEGQRANDPRWVKLREFQEKGAAARAESDGVRKERRASNGSGSKPTSGTCHHCGGPTKGGKFMAGHDAKLKGELIREATADAVAEAMVRGWYKSGRLPELEKDAEAILQAIPTHEFLERRNATRSGRFDRGEDQ